MRRRRPRWWFGGVALAAALMIACGDGGTPDDATPVVIELPTPEATATPVTPAPPVRGEGEAAMEEATAWGIAGLVPANFPESTDDDWIDFYESLVHLGGWVGTFASWTADGGTPDIMRSQAQAGHMFGFHTIPSLGFARQAAGEYELAVDFADPAQVDAFTDAAVELAREGQFAYFGIGNEINLLWEEAPEAFYGFVDALPSITAAIREASPGTRIFTSFQLEFLRGGGAISGEIREERWDLIDHVTDALDFVAFTSYPWFDYETPADIPDDYYREVAQRSEIPVAFSELGWPGEPLSTAPDSPFGGSAEDQAAFVERLPELLEDVDPVFALWVFAHDLDDAGDLFDALGLRERDGTSRPALNAWREMIATP